MHIHKKTGQLLKHYVRLTGEINVLRNRTPWKKSSVKENLDSDEIASKSRCRNEITLIYQALLRNDIVLLVNYCNKKTPISHEINAQFHFKLPVSELQT